MERHALHGVNLSGWLCLESWITPELFAGTGSLAEPDIVATIGVDCYRDLIREHRSGFVTETDFELIARRGFNAVRIPVPWYAFGEEGPECGPLMGCIPELDRAFAWAADYGISVLIVLAISPSATEDSDLITGPGHSRRQSMVRVLERLAARYQDEDALFGIEVAHEPKAQHREGLLGVTEGVPMASLRTYYREAYAAIRGAAGERPVVVLPDAGVPGAWKSFMAQGHYRNVWLDCHLYHYDEHVDATGPAGAATLVARSRKILKTARKGHLPVMVGAWSAALPFADSLMTPEGRIALERVYCAEQIAAFEGLPAWFFQTWKTSGHLSGWDSRTALASFERRMLS